MKKLTLIVSLVLVISPLVHSQPVNKVVNDVTMPSSNAASLGKYGDIPVNLFTGVPKITIPLHTISNGSISVPINLNYHSSGIKVGELASWVGQGWSLQSGGMITRSTMGLPDELSGVSGYFDNGSSLVAPMLFGNSTSTLQMTESANGVRDTEPDIFNFSMPGYSGKFLFDSNQKVHFFPKADFKISYARYSSTERFIRFIITAPDGTRYIFGTLESEALTSNSGIEYTYYDGQANATVDAPSSWYLRRIETGNKLFSIDFEYTDEKYAYKTLATCRFEWDSSNPNVSCGGTPYGSGSYKNVIIHKINGKRLTAIVSGTNKVKFIATTDRADLDTYSTTSKKALDKIEIYNATETTCLKAINFNYSYFEDPAGTASEYKRLKLEKVTEVSCDLSKSKPPHIFTYDPGLVPNRLSKAIDHWGFYNGQTTNETKFNIPTLSIPYQGGISTPPFAGANRTTSEPEMKNGVLTKIEYPTGGSTAFSYEANKFTTTTPITSKIFLTDNLSNCTYPSGTCCTTLSNTIIETFTSTELSGAKYYLGLYNLNTSTQNPSGQHFCNSGQNPGPQPKVKVTVRQTGSTTNLGSTNFAISPTTGYSYIDETLTNLAVLSAGVSYTFTIEVEHGKGEFYVYKNTTTTQPTTTNIGGLRISQIKTHDGISTNQDVIKNYTYYNPNTTNSSGVLYFKPEYYGFAYDYTGGIQGVVFHDYSIAPLNNVNGYHIGYQYIEEERVGAGKKRYHYHSEQNFTIPNSHPYTPDATRIFDGNLLIESLYNTSNAVVSTTHNTFNNDAYSNIPGIIYKAYAFTNSIGSIAQYAKSYVPRTSIFRLSNIESTLDGVTTNRSYEYASNDLYFAPNKESTLNSDGAEYVTTFTYPQDLSGGIYIDMLAKNIITPVVITQKVNDTIVDRQTIVYQNQTLGTVNYPYPKIMKRDEVTWTGASGIYSRDSNVVHTTITERSAITGFPTKISIDGWSAPIEYTWNANGTQQQWKFKDFKKTYVYEPGTTLLKKMTNIDKTSSEYTYDNLMRLSTIKDSCRNVTTTLNYNYGTPDTGGNNISSTTVYPAVTNSALSTITNKQFFDGLGRPIQSIKVKQGPTSTRDVIIATAYDNQGRVQHQYEPLESAVNNNGAFYTGSLGDYSTTTYEASPLNRPISQTHTAWPHPTTTTYGKNTSMINGIGANKLFKQTIIDADSKESITYTDTRGRTIATQMAGSGGSAPLTTLYKYDPKDRPTKIIPPGSTASTTGLNFTYQYYANDLVKYKKVPDQDQIEYRYNDRDLLIHYQDGLLQSQSKWMAYNYDRYGRDSLSGFTTSPLPNNNGANPSISTSELLTQSDYYTSGNHIDKIEKAFTRELKSNGTLGHLLESNFTYDACGRIKTDKGQTLLSTTTVHNRTHEYTYDWADNLLKDDHQQIIYGTHNIDASRTVDFAGRPEASILSFAGSTETLSKISYTEKDQVQQLKLGDVTTSSALQLVDYTYKGNGWLEKINNSNLGGGDYFYQELLYNNVIANSDATNHTNGNIGQIAHRVQGGDIFLYGFTYDNYNRLTAATSHELKGSNLQNSNRYDASYSYDDRSNLMSMTQKDMVPGSAALSSETIDNLTYTRVSQSNRISSISENATGTYKHRGAKSSNNNTFIYDANGNMTYDPTREITIHYTHFNKPRLVDYGDGRTIGWTYDADGNLLRKEVKQGTSVLEDRYYIGAAEYKDGQLVQVMHDHGRVARENGCDQNQHIPGLLATDDTYYGDHIISDALVTPTGPTEFKADASIVLNPDFEVRDNKIFEAYIETCTPGAWQYQYRIADYQNNTRLVITEDGDDSDTAPDIIQEMHYSPYGRPLNGNWNNSERHDYQYKYNDKEVTEDYGLNHSNYGARWQDLDLIDFTTIDRFADKYPWQSPYVHAGRNPIKYIDVNGDSLNVKFTGDEAREAFVRIMNNGLEGQFEVIISNQGIVTFAATKGGGDVSKLSVHGKAFYEENSKILNAGGVTNVTVDYANPRVHTGNLALSSIDMADIEQFNLNPSDLGGTQIGKLTHEIVEQGHAQGGTGKINGDPYTLWKAHHPTAIYAEDNVNNSTRNDPYGGGIQEYSRGGNTVRTLIHTKEYGGWRYFFMKKNRSIVKVKNYSQ